MATLADLRKNKNISQKELANSLSITAAAVCNYEKGKRELRISLIPQYAEVLQVSIQELLSAAIMTLDIHISS